jgi:ubiquinone/menaquinone biosynthesis C-methylase UbiE
MDKSFESRYHILEEEHWWFTGRREIILQLMKNIDENSGILEVGCSGGMLVSKLQKKGYTNIKGIDISSHAISQCKKKGISNVQVMDGSATSFDPETFNIVVASDILEHINQEKKALKEWNRILKPGGTLIVFVPAFSILWSDHDKKNYHFRRYSKKRLLKILNNSGFSVKRSSYWNFFLFLPLVFARVIDRILMKRMRSFEQLKETSRFMDTIFLTCLRIENRILRLLDFPFGVSVFAIAKKKYSSGDSDE